MEPLDRCDSLPADPPRKQRLLGRSRALSMGESAPTSLCHHQPTRKTAGSGSSGCLAVSSQARAAAAAFRYARTGDAERALLDLLAGAPDLLDDVDANGDSPIGVALLSGQEGAAERLVDLAARCQPDLLGHRSVAGETLLMLAMGRHRASPGAVRQLLRWDPAQVYEKYDAYGKNVFHHCAEDASLQAVEDLLASLADVAVEEAEAPTRVDLRRVRLALEMPDCAGWTPLHYLARADRVEMLQLLHQFCRRQGACTGGGSSPGLDLAVREMGGGARRWTPLRLATESGSARVREFLLDVGLVEDDEDDEDDNDDDQDGDGSSDVDDEAELDVEVFQNASSKPTAEADLLHRMQQMSLLPPDALRAQSQALSQRLLQADQMQQLYLSVQRLDAIKADHIQLAKLASNPVHCLIGFLPRDKRSRCGQECG